VGFRPSTWLVFASLLVAAVVPVAAGRGTATVLSARNGALGEILVSAAGRTLYHTAAEKTDRVACVGACAVRWPPLVITARAKPVAGLGVRSSLLGTVRRPDGRLQVTYRGLPLYLFSGDARAGDVNGQGVSRVWHALTPGGAIVTKAVTASSSSTTTTGSSSSMGSAPAPGVNPGMWCAANPQSCVNGVPIGGG